MATFGTLFGMLEVMTQKLMTIAPVLLAWPLAFGQNDFEEHLVPLPIQELETESRLRTLEHGSFKAGEKLTYILHYGFMNAGEATLELKETEREVHGRKILHAVGKGRTLGAFNWFFKVEDRYETYMDQQGVFPYLFIRRVDEGGYKISQDYTFNQPRQQVTTEEKETFDVPPHVQDMLSSFYFARTMDFSQTKVGDTFTFDCFLDEEIFPLRMKYLGKETIKVRKGKFRCMKFVPVVQEGRIFKSNEDLEVWITDDGNKIPILAKANIAVGSIKMELTKYEGLSHPIAKVSKK